MVRSNGSPALTVRYTVEMLPQSDLPFAEKHFVASMRQVLPIVGAADLELGDLLGVARVPLMRAPVDVFQRTDSALRLRPFRIPPSQQLKPRPRRRLSCSSVWIPNSMLRSCASGTVCRHNCATWRSIYIARRELLWQSTNYATFSMNFRTFFPGPKRVLALTY